jgi:predicted urease superfamily metal-dependent hydrolase
MQKGDLSNELPKRVIVIADTFLDYEISMRKAFGLINVPKKEERINRALLSRLYLFAQNVGYTMELGSFSLQQKDLEALMDQLDIMGTNPFRYCNHYSSLDSLVGELPYRPEVIGVLDLPDKVLRYGHWGLDFGQL